MNRRLRVAIRYPLPKSNKLEVQDNGILLIGKLSFAKLFARVFCYESPRSIIITELIFFSVTPANLSLNMKYVNPQGSRNRTVGS